MGGWAFFSPRKEVHNILANQGGLLCIEATVTHVCMCIVSTQKLNLPSILDILRGPHARSSTAQQVTMAAHMYYTN